MAVEKCSSCDAFIDLDVNVEGIVYLNDTPICENCIDVDVCLEEIDRLNEELSRARQEVTSFGNGLNKAATEINNLEKYCRELEADVRAAKRDY